MVAVDTIARYEALRRRLAAIKKQLGTMGAMADDEAKSIYAELMELERRLPNGYEWRG